MAKISSLQRVKNAAEQFGIDIEIQTMDQSTRTAQEAADAAGCSVAQIVKSLIFEDQATKSLILLLVSGQHNADIDFITNQYGLVLGRCDGRRVRNETGFAIGGVAPIGHLIDIKTYMDESLLEYETVWAAAGRPDSVFSVSSQALADAIQADIIKVVA